MKEVPKPINPSNCKEELSNILEEIKFYKLLLNTAIVNYNNSKQKDLTNVNNLKKTIQALSDRYNLVSRYCLSVVSLNPDSYYGIFGQPKGYPLKPIVVKPIVVPPNNP